jgi:competence protein ComEA
VYSLPVGCRVQDAIATAGGLLAQADTQALNLAAAVQDGERIFVPASAPTRSPPLAPAAGAAQELPDWQFPTPTSGLTNINTASQAELEDLPNIGPVTAQKIIAYRDSHGPFTGIEAIQEVPGIGPKTFEAIKDLITVGG